MNNSFTTYMKELDFIPSVRRITASREWTIVLGDKRIDSDADLIGLIAELSTLLRRGLNAEVQAGALLGVLYVTARILDTCQKIKLKDAKNSMEIDLAISLELPGESTSGLAFLKANDRLHREDLGVRIEALLSTINNLFVGCPSNTTIKKECTQDLPLLILSRVYCCLVDMVFENLEHFCE